MKVSDFNYDLPRAMIASYPVEPRDSSRLLVLHRDTGAIEHRVFRDIVEYLRPDDLLVLNNTRVIPARIEAVRPTGGKMEMLFLEPSRNSKKDDGPHWTALGQAKGKPHRGERLRFADGETCAEILDKSPEGIYTLRFAPGTDVVAMLERAGNPPLPMYILRSREQHTTNADDPTRYQTTYAQKPGAVAAPTAGLHFTEELLKGIAERGVEIARVTLHVGFGTFQPVRVENVEDHEMHRERYSVTAKNAERLRHAVDEGRRIVSVGTTTTRVLETIVQKGEIAQCSSSTDIFIYPPYDFKHVGAQITNFHLPESTLLMMICALAGRERVLAAYEEAKREGYRFYSYGDAMLIL